MPDYLLSQHISNTVRSASQSWALDRAEVDQSSIAAIQFTPDTRVDWPIFVLNIQKSYLVDASVRAPER
jgi:hypothetical protein